MKKYKIGMIGTGKLGGPCAEVIAEKGHEVHAYDTNEDCNFKKVVQWRRLQGLYEQKPDIVFIAVPTPHDERYDGKEPTAHLEPKDFDYTIVKECLQDAAKYAHKDTLVVLISTVLPGTIRREFSRIIKNLRFVYNPYLIAMGTVAWDMVNPEMVMIGTKDGDETGDAKQLVDFYKTIMENDPRYEIGTWDECEAIKVFYNTFISMKIGFVNMIQDVAERQGNINADVVANALSNSTQRIMSNAYMKPGLGDAGACHPRDNIALRYMSEHLELGYDLFGSIMEAREIQARNMAKKLISLTNYQMPVVIMGKSYKPGVDYTEGSSSMLVGHYVEYLRGELYYDTILEEPAVYLLAHPEEEFNVLEGSVIVDPWRKVKTNNKVYYYGNTRQK